MNMKISVFGLGYVGAVTAACLAKDGHQVIGVDVNKEKVRMVNSGESPVVEPGLGDLLREVVAHGALRATDDAEEALFESDVSLVSVGTPSNEFGHPDLRYVWKVAEEMAHVLGNKSGVHTVVLRSTVPPGTLREFAHRVTGGGASQTVQFAFNPEFLREGNAIKDYYNPPFTLIGAMDRGVADVMQVLYSKIDAPVIVVRPEVAEMVKYVCNAWHALKVGFANEIGRLGRALGIDAREVMDIVTRDTKLNISKAYLSPGFAYGGSCLPKDVSALISIASQLHVEVPLLESLPRSNQLEIELAVRDVMRSGPSRVAVLGIAFKSGSDDLRNSPYVEVVKRVMGEGCKVRIYDEAVRPDRLTGANLRYIRERLPHFEGLLTSSIHEAVEGADVIVISHKEYLRPDLMSVISNRRVVDLTRTLAENDTKEVAEYVPSY